MKQNQSKAKMILFCITIFLTALVSQHESGIFPIAGALYEAFPDSTMAINFVISGPSLLMLFASLLVPYIYKVLSKKTALIITCTVFAASAICATFAMSLPLLITYRTIGGFCIGFQQVIALDMVTDYFLEDEKARATVVGLYNASQAGIGAILGIVAGNLAVNGWENVFKAYWVAIPITILVVCFVPNIRNSVQSADKAEEKSGEKVPMGSKFMISVVNFMIYTVIYAPLFMMAAVYVSENALGNEAYSGLISSVGTVGSLICCLTFGLFYKKLRMKTSLISYVIMAAGLFVAFLVPNSTVFIVINVVCGGAYGLLLSYQYANASAIVAPQNTTKAISYITALNALGFFVCTYVTTWIMGITGGITGSCAVYGVVAVVCLIIEVINTKRMAA